MTYPKPAAWRWRYSNKGPWQYTENPPSSGLYDGCEYEPLHTTHPAPQPALALIEELEEAMMEARVALSCCYNVTDWPADGSTSQDDAIKALDTALASAKRFKEGS